MAKRTRLGSSRNTFTVEYPDWHYDENKEIIPINAFTAEEIDLLQDHFSRIVPLMRKLWGPPAIDTTVSIILDLRKSSIATYYPPGKHFIILGGKHEVVDDFQIVRKIAIKRLLGLVTHEAAHAYRCGHIISAINGQYTPIFDCFEESLAQAMRYQITAAHLEEYGWSFHNRVDPNLSWFSDFMNVRALATEQFFTDYGSLGLWNARYEIGAWQILKIIMQDKDFIRSFHRNYFNWSEDEKNKTGRYPLNSRKAIIKVFKKTVRGRVEGKKIEAFLNQPIFAAAITTGPKLWLDTNYTKRPDGLRKPEFLSRNKICFYTTSTKGNDFYDDGGNKWPHADKEFDINVRTIDGRLLYAAGAQNFTPKTEPVDRFGKYRLWFTSAEFDDSRVFEEKEFYDRQDIDLHAVEVKEPGLYVLDITVRKDAEEIHREQFYRILGDLKNFEGIAVGVKDGKDGDYVKVIDLERRGSDGHALKFHAEVKNGLALCWHPEFDRKLERIEDAQESSLYDRDEREDVIAAIKKEYSMLGRYRISYYANDQRKKRTRDHIFKTLPEGYRGLNMILI